jgi:non-ribosomal peptide synthetase component F
MNRNITHVPFPAQQKFTDCPFSRPKYFGSLTASACGTALLEKANRPVAARTEANSDASSSKILYLKAMISGDGYSKSVQEILLESFARYADRIAVEDQHACLSYAEVGAFSAGVAERILDQIGDAPGCVALAFGQNARYLVALFAALRSGKAFVPLDPRRGLLWNQNIVLRTASAIVLYDSENAGFATELGIPAIEVDPSLPVKGTGLVVPRPADDTACIYPTSGTTGPPKAVCDSHRNLLHNAARYASSLEITPSDRLSLIQAPVFSGTQSTIFMALTRGAALCCLDVANGSLAELPSWLAECRATVFHSVPSIFRTLGNRRQVFRDVRLVRLEGDQPTDRDVDVFRASFNESCKLVVGLGATECGLIRQHFISFDEGIAPGALPAGKTVRDMDVSIRDEAGIILPRGAKGEVWVTSRYLAKGYLGDEKGTRERFPVSADGRRSYRTGDLGRIDEDGVLWLLGRNDRKVKIRGESVDLNDVEAALSKLSFVTQALVSAREDGRGETVLTAHLVAGDDEKPSVASVRAAMAEMLPRNLVPGRVTWLDQLPVTRDGKLDRSALPEVTCRPDAGTEYVAPRTETEKAVAEIWQEVLGVIPVGVFDDLFSLGIDSLSIVRFADVARQRLRTKIKIASVYENPTVAGIAAIIASDRDRVAS